MVKWKAVLLHNGDPYYKDDIAANNLDPAKYLSALDQGDILTSMKQEGTINGHPTGYWVIRPVKDPEVNEFGEVTP